MRKKFPNIFHFSLRKYFTIAYKISLVTVILAGWLFIKFSIDQERRTIEEKISEVGEQIEETISYNIDYLKYHISYTAEQIKKDPRASDKKIASILSSFVGNISDQIDLSITWNAFSWIGKDDKIVADGAVGVLKKSINMSERDYMKITKTIPNKLVIGKPVFGALSNRLILPVAIGVFSDQNEYLGTLVFGLDIERILLKITKNIGNETFEFAVINNREIAFNSDNLSKKNSDFIEKNLTKIFNKSENEIISSQSIFSENDQFIGLHTAKENSLKILVFYNQDKSRTQITNIAIKQSFFILLIALAFVILFQKIYKQVVQPVISISKLALKISKKDFSFTIEKPKGRELLGLYEAINSLKEALLREEELKNQLEITNKKLRKANEAKVEFLAKSSHDLKNYICGIFGLSRLILDNKTKSEILENEDLQMVETIHDQSEELIDFLEDLLDTNQVESGNFTLEKIQNCDAQELIDRILLLNKSLAIQNGINFKIEIENNLPALPCDIRRMKQILSNLISNAIKYSKAGSSVTVIAKHLKKEQQIYLEISDNGIGMTEEEIKMVLGGRGKEIGKSELSNVDSHGIGMPIVLKLVELHQGKIEIESKKNIGTKVRLFFSLADNFSKKMKVS